MTYRPNTFLTFSGSYDNYRLNKKYYWLEELEEIDGSLQYIFSDFDKNLKIYSLRTSGNIGRKLSIQLYSEIFQNDDTYSNYSQYIDSLKTYETFIEDIYTTDENEVQSQTSSLILDPNYYIGLYPRYTSFIFNGVLKWNYAHGSNLYIVYTARKSVNGKKFPKISDFFQYNKEGRWVETLRDQTIMVKIDYWFEI